MPLTRIEQLDVWLDSVKPPARMALLAKIEAKYEMHSDTNAMKVIAKWRLRPQFPPNRC
jgi:hypothetical protein